MFNGIIFNKGFIKKISKRSKGINIWDLKGKKYFDFTMIGVGSCVLGYSDPDKSNPIS